jgi:hypothetical protein
MILELLIDSIGSMHVSLYVPDLGKIKLNSLYTKKTITYDLGNVYLEISLKYMTKVSICDHID